MKKVSNKKYLDKINMMELFKTIKIKDKDCN